MSDTTLIQDVKRLAATASQAELRQAALVIVKGLKADLNDCCLFCETATEKELTTLLEKVELCLQVVHKR